MVLDGKASQEYPVNAGVPKCSILGPTLLLLYINDLPDDVICNIAICADNTTVYSKWDLICGNSLNWFLYLNLIYETLWTRFSPEIALYLHKSTIRPCMEYCYHVWAVGTSLAASLEPLAHL